MNNQNPYFFDPVQDHSAFGLLDAAPIDPTKRLSELNFAHVGFLAAPEATQGYWEVLVNQIERAMVADGINVVPVYFEGTVERWILA